MENNLNTCVCIHIYIYVYIHIYGIWNHSALYLKLTQYYKLYFSMEKKEERERWRKK